MRTRKKILAALAVALVLLSLLMSYASPIAFLFFAGIMLAALVCLYWLVTNLIDKKMSKGSLAVFFLIWFGVSASSLATVSASDLATLLGAILGGLIGGLIVAVPLFLLARWIARKTMKPRKRA